MRLVEVLNAIYEEDFPGFSYGFRPGRGPHDALDALAVGIGRAILQPILLQISADAMSRCACCPT